MMMMCDSNPRQRLRRPLLLLLLCAAVVPRGTPPVRALPLATPENGGSGVGEDGGSYTVLNNTDLSHGDDTALDFSLPKGTGDAAGIAACSAACDNHSSVCTAWVFVREVGAGHPSAPRCAIKGPASGWCLSDVATSSCVAGIRAGVTPQPCAGSSAWRLPAINWTVPGVVGPTQHEFAVRAFDVVQWPGDGRWYLYCDLVMFSNPECPSSYGSELGVFSADSLDAEWTYHGIAVHRNTSATDAGGVATPTAVVQDGKVLVYFAYEAMPFGAGLRGIAGAWAVHPRGPFTRLAEPVAPQPLGWHRPSGPGGILDAPQVLFYGGRLHLFHSRKHVSDLNCSLTPEDPRSPVVDHCVEWRTSTDGGMSWERRGVLAPPPGGLQMSETMSARVYPNDTLVVITDGRGGMVSFTANATGLLQDDPRALVWTPGVTLNGYAGLNASFVNVALRVLPVDAAVPTHVGLGWRAPGLDPRGQCPGAMTFSVFPLLGGAVATAAAP